MASRLKEEFIVNKHDVNEDLLVFGYSCKLFRDDEKALYIDQGKHLIPWMGDESLKIDRYDARGTLFDLKQVEAPSGGFDRFFGLTDMERQVETMCDEERYRALVTNEEEESLYQEEELKRLHYAIGDKGNSYGQVEYKYNGDTNLVDENAGNSQVEKLDDVEDEPFVPSPTLDLPINMIVPETMKHNAIIEKTAMFISNQGPQMEIVLKIKQARNPQFSFLSFDNPLHSYYRHLLMAIKGGRYNPNFECFSKTEEAENDEDDHYLHPSLASSVSKVELAPSIPSINYKPSAHCAYSMLVNKIKDKKNNEQGNHLSRLKEALERLKDEKNIENESDSERCLFSTNSNSNALEFPTPPKDIQIIIDKMASYVAKNGRDFEAVVQMKNDPRFDFLNSAHIYYPYYRHKIKQYEVIEKSLKPETKNSESSILKLKDEQLKSKLAPVSFSIKKPKEVEPVIEKSALPVEESSDEEEKEEKEKEKETYELKEKDGKEEVLTIDLAAMEEKEERNKKILATERLKDKLTAAAREKIAMATKEKQLQLDRKRRAAAFLRAIHSDGKSLVVYGPQLPEEMGKDAEGSNDAASVPDAFVEPGEDKVEKLKRTDYSKRKSVRLYDEKRHRTSHAQNRQKRIEKHGSKLEKAEKSLLDEEKKLGDMNEKVMDSSLSSDEDLKKKVLYVDKIKKIEESLWKNKSGGSRSFRDDEKRHKKKRHKRENVLDRSSRKHLKLKRERRGRQNEDSKIVKQKKSRRNSSSSSGQNS